MSIIYDAERRLNECVLGFLGTVSKTINYVSLKQILISERN